jgi:hypothetical protein
MKIQIYDTTLRDGTQRTDISLSASDKINIARQLDDLGVAYIEGGWPGSNPKDAEFFRRAAALTGSMRKSRPSAPPAGSTGRHRTTPTCRRCSTRAPASAPWWVKAPPCMWPRFCAPAWKTTCASLRKA